MYIFYQVNVLMPIETIAQPIQYVKTMLQMLMDTYVNAIPIINQSITSAHVSIVKYCFPLQRKLCCYIFVNSLSFLHIKLLWIFVAISIIILKDFQFFPHIHYENLTILQFNLVLKLFTYCNEKTFHLYNCFLFKIGQWPECLRYKVKMF